MNKIQVKDAYCSISSLLKNSHIKLMIHYEVYIYKKTSTKLSGYLAFYFGNTEIYPNLKK